MEPVVQQATTVSYEGARSASGLFHGRGRAVLANGIVCDGDWRDGLLDGEASVVFPDGVGYAGGVRGNNAEGEGTYRWPGATYEGGVRAGRRHGLGTMSFDASPAVYEGEWADSMRHGHGVLYFNPERTAYYDGEWERDMKQGYGIMVYPSGNVYEGEWAADEKCGHGIMRWHTSGQAYTGQWAHGVPNGLGEHTWEQDAAPGSSHATCLMHNRYRGQFLDGRRHGEGALLYSSGARYEGTWAADRKEGEGVYVFEDGTVFEGRFVADRPDVACGRFSFGSSGAPSDGGNSGGNGGSGANSGSSGGGSAAGAAATPEKGGRRGAAKGADSAAASGSTQAGPAPPPAAAGAHLPAQPAAGFGPRVASLQLYIDDLLEGTEAPPAAAKAVLNLLVGANPELRALYDRYCKRASPFVVAAAAERAGFGLQAGQLWELARDAGLLSRHTPLAEVAAAIAAARKPPPPVAARRARVLAGGGAAACAVLPLDACGAWPVAAYVDTGSQGTAAVPGSCCAADASRSGAAAAYDPLVELSFREFAECLVRIAALRYPQLPSPARSLQVVLQQHVVPLLTSSRQRQPQGSAGAVGACAAGAAAAAALQRSQQLAAAPAVATSASAAAGWEQQMASEEVVGFLRLRSKQLQAAFAAVAIEALPGAGGSGGASAALGLGAAANADSGMWQSAHTTARRVLRAFEREGLLGVHRLQAGQVAAALLEGLLGAKDAAQGPRLRLDCGPEDEPCDGDADDAPSAAQLAEWRAREVALWADQKLAYPEFVWGLARVAALLPPPPRSRGVSGKLAVGSAGGMVRAPSRSATRRSGAGAAAGVGGADSAAAAAPGGGAAAGADERSLIEPGLLGALRRLLEGPDGFLTRMHAPAAGAPG